MVKSVGRPRSGSTVPTHWTAAALTAEIARLIETGADGFKPGEQLPTYEEFRPRWGVSVATASRIIRDLKLAGLIDSVPGKGTFVAERTTDG